MMTDKPRCEWVSADPIYITYHDEEWGNMDRFHNDNYLFEMLVLEGAQAGLSWLTILKRRENYREAFRGFDPILVANFGEKEVEALLQNEGIIRNRRKIESASQNAKAVIRLQKEFGSFHAFLWDFIDEKPIINHWEKHADVPAATALSTGLSRELKKRGFSFVGPVICYSFLQAVGLVQDHTAQCFLGK
jgi:DNA-3-methyladenine glycosylase I